MLWYFAVLLPKSYECYVVGLSPSKTHHEQYSGVGDLVWFNMQYTFQDSNSFIRDILH